MKFQRKKKTTGWDITKNVEGGGFRPPALLGLNKKLDIIFKVLPTLSNISEISNLYYKMNVHRA